MGAVKRTHRQARERHVEETREKKYINSMSRAERNLLMELNTIQLKGLVDAVQIWADSCRAIADSISSEDRGEENIKWPSIISGERTVRESKGTQEETI